MGYTPTYDARSLSVHIGTVGGGAMTAGSANLGPVGFTPLPGHTTAQYFTVADVGRIVTVFGAGASGGILIAKIASYVDTQNVVLTVAASTSVTGDQSNVTVYRPCSVMKDALGHSTSLTSRDSAQFTARSLDGTFVPVEGQPVLFVSTDPAVGIYEYGVFFGGSIDSVKVQNYPGNAMLTSECECISWENLAAKRVMMGQKYLTTAAGTIFADIIAKGLIGDFVGVNAVTGPTVAELTIDDYTVVSDALDTLAQKISDAVDVYFWKADPFRRYTLALQTTTSAPWTIDHSTGSDSNILASLSATRTREKYSNHAYLEASQRLNAAQTYTVKIGTVPVAPPPGYHSRSITLPAIPTVMPSMKLDGAALVVKASGVDPQIDGTATNPPGADWVWLVGTDRLWTDLSHPGLTVGHTIVVTYQTSEAGHAFYENGPGVAQRSAIEGGSGYYETLTNVDRPLSQDELQDLAQSVAKRFGTVPTIVDIETYRPGLRVGQELTINRREVAGTFIVSSAEMSLQDGRPRWSITATNGSVIGDWRTALAAALGGSVSVAGGGGGSVRLGAPPLPLKLTAALPSGTVGVAYSGPLIATGGSSPYAFSIASGSLPSWATLGAETGVISGTPTTAATSTFTARVTDSASLTQDYACTLVIVAAASAGAGSGAIPPANVSIDKVEADAKPTTGSAVRGARNTTAKRGITIRYTPPSYASSPVDFAPHRSSGWDNPSRYYATASSVASTSYPAWRAFDGSGSTRWISGGSCPQWLMVAVGAKQRLDSYAITVSVETGRAPTAWNLQGSNDGATWTTIDSRSSITGWGDPETKTFSVVGNSTAYWMYRLYVTASAGSNPAISELYLYTTALNTASDVAPHNMTGASAPAPYAVTESGHVSSYEGWGAFDDSGSGSTYNSWASTPTSWIVLDVGTATPIRGYMVFNVNASDSPTSWTLEGSNDGSSWASIDSKSSVTWNNNGVTDGIATACGLPADTTAYRYFRLTITASAGSTAWLRELHLIPAAVPAAPTNTFRGVFVEIEAPDQTTLYSTRGGRPGRFLDGSLALSSVDLSGPRAPYTFGPFAHSITDGSLRVEIPEPDSSQLPMGARCRLISYSDDMQNSADTSPSQPFTIPDPVAAKPSAGTAYAPNPVRVLIPSTVPGSGARGAAQANPYRTTVSGVDETHLWVTIDLDARANGYQLVLINPSGDHLNASGIERAPHFELVFNTPAAVGVYTVYACGSDGTNINPLVDGITPSVKVTLGTDDGTVDLKHTTPGSRGRGLDVEDGALSVQVGGPLYEDGSGNINVAAGLGLGLDGDNQLSVKIDGPLYADVAGNINLKISPHFVVTTDGTLTQDIVDLALATGFDTSAFSGGGGSGNLTMNSGWIAAQAIACNQLVAGNALFAGDASFSRIGGGKVTINSAGVAIADNLSVPTATVTATSSGVTIAKGSNSVQITSLGVLINGPSGTLTATSSGVVITNGSSSVTVSSSAVAIVNGTMSLTSGTATMRFDASNYIKLTDTGTATEGYLAPGSVVLRTTATSGLAALTTFNGGGGLIHGALLLQTSTGAQTILTGVSGTPFNASTPSGYLVVLTAGGVRYIPYFT